MAKFQTILHDLFIQSWWVITFILICTVLYETGLKNREELYLQLTEQKVALEKEGDDALRHQHNLQLQINSQSDLAWVELTLMKGLGVVPEGEQKIYFFPNDPCRSNKNE